jgi:hypothetical protein
MVSPLHARIGHLPDKISREEDDMYAIVPTYALGVESGSGSEGRARRHRCFSGFDAAAGWPSSPIRVPSSMDDAQAEKLVAASTPIYHGNHSLHGEDLRGHRYMKSIRQKVNTLITPRVEVDRRDRVVDIYRRHRENPGKK